MTEGEAVTALRGAELRLGERKTKEAPDRVGRVLHQSPAAGAKAASGSAVALVIGIGETRMVEVPDLVNVTLRTAKRKIKAAGLELGTVSGPSPKGQSIVEEQEPLAGAEVPPGATVNLTIRSAKK
jgi:beta-lactam-binding protein with PASTA domain